MTVEKEHPVRCFREVEDYEESIKNNDFKIVFLYDDNAPETPMNQQKANRKYPVGGPKGYKTLDDVYLNDFNMQRNIGVCPIRKENEKFLCVIDIDGETTYASNDQEQQELKLATRLYLFEILKNGFHSRDLHPMFVSTANNGYHIYIYVTQAGHKKHPVDNLVYPSKNLKGFVDSSAFNQFPVLQNVGLKPMAKSAIEFFTEAGKYVVGPGSIINGKKYNVLDSGVKRFKDISVYMEKPIEDLIYEIFEEAGFTIDYDHQKEMIQRKIVLDDSKHDIPEQNVANIGDFIIEAWPLIDGEKQMATVALGGFLSSMGVSQKSLMDIGNYVIDNKTSPNFFNMNDDAERTQGFIPSLLHDSEENAVKKKQGLSSLKERFMGKYDIYKMSRLLWLNSCPKTHKFYPNEKYTTQYDEVVLDFHKKQIRLNHIRQGKEANLPVSNDIVFHVVDNFEYIDDISTPLVLDSSEMPIQFDFYATNGFTKKYIFENRQKWFDNFHKMFGAYTSKNSKIPGYILKEYEDLGVIRTIESSSRPGIYLSKDQTRFRKFIDEEESVVEVECNPPDRDELRSALMLLKQICDAFPWTEDKFAATIKHALLLPYAFSYKRFNRWIPGVMLIGESGTLKSTMGQLLCSLHTPIKYNKRAYVMNGSEFNSEFRIGRDMNRHSYPIVINECMSVFSVQGNLEYIKDTITEEFGRNPGASNGDEGGIYYNRCIPIFTLNDSVEGLEEREFARRFLTINLTKKDLYTEQEIEENLSFLNKGPIVNGRFEELHILGDFVFYFINNNISLFSKPIYSTMDSIIRGLQEYTGIDTSWLNVNVRQYIDMDFDESSQYDLDKALNVIKQPFAKKKSRNISGKSDEEILEEMMGIDYPFIFRTKNGVLITTGFKDAYRESDKNLNRTMKITELKDLLNINFADGQEVCEYKTSQIKGSSQTKRGVTVPWELFLEIVGAKINENITEILQNQ